MLDIVASSNFTIAGAPVPVNTPSVPIVTAVVPLVCCIWLTCNMLAIMLNLQIMNPPPSLSLAESQKLVQKFYGHVSDL